MNTKYEAPAVTELGDFAEATGWFFPFQTSEGLPLFDVFIWT
ncbi:lasso RiPP family leader peptide-containing protein [Streptosporangium sp. LJ11]